MPFAQQELDILLITRGIGPEVVRRLEEAGLDSFRALRELGIEATVAKVCRQVGSIGWANRRRPLARALEAAAHQHGEPA